MHARRPHCCRSCRVVLLYLDSHKSASAPPSSTSASFSNAPPVLIPILAPILGRSDAESAPLQVHCGADCLAILRTTLWLLLEPASRDRASGLHGAELTREFLGQMSALFWPAPPNPAPPRPVPLRPVFLWQAPLSGNHLSNQRSPGQCLSGQRL